MNRRKIGAIFVIVLYSGILIHVAFFLFQGEPFPLFRKYLGEGPIAMGVTVVAMLGCARVIVRSVHRFRRQETRRET